MVNSSINCLRSKKRRAKLISAPQENESPEESLLGDERRAMVLRGISQLSEQHQRVLTLRDVRGLSYPEIARILNWPEGTVKSALNRGRARLVEAMDRLGERQKAG